ncbi:phosphate ABC transporter substrate-binding protein PstS family protein [Parageobacillus toebii]|uniref:Phosphate-binding protein n=2 Tax=Anoxybacillaceae TaxID=3120669 RepID=A0AA89NZT0_9BACL|nr:phosphate ABC transporter substrate-binding protein PstS family protein [Parageobacillus toebii]MBB3867452.1 phosphate transport system substrate-binding protein [Parageobacillus toebii NBRC 107807]MED4969670.1 phosphate ABC transporter substrate-binding protein PstS family protein [Parageobacillus toebii]MED4988605.1 phosphate ABC transporter substrate-binding protein PstS family protein [Parageobacillus toebii]QSB50063.1 phosphate ABC transporter substrate-binding protein PstS family prote
MMRKKPIRFGIAALLITGMLAGCGKSDNTTGENSGNTETKQEESYSGTITLAGSTALQPLAEEAANQFMEKYPDVSITVQGGGSGTGVNQVAAGAVQIGNSDVPSAEKLEDKSKAGELIDHKVAGIAFALVVNKDVNVDSLTVQQIQDIFSGKITNWKDVGGKDEKINVINRPASSGTRATFEKTVMKDVKINEAIGTVQDSNGAVEQAINSTPGSISYVAMSYLIGEKKDLKTLKIDGVEPTIENIKTEKYPFWSYEYMITKGEPKDAVRGFIEYVKSKEFAPKVKEMGYIPMPELE